jgi:hypothetical protein
VIDVKDDSRNIDPEMMVAPVVIKDSLASGIKVLGLQNTTGQPIDISSMSFLGNNQFKVQGTNIPLPYQLPIDGRINVTVRYFAGEEHSFSDKLQIRSGENVLSTIDFTYGNPATASVAVPPNVVSSNEMVVSATPNPFSGSLQLNAKNGTIEKIQIFNTIGEMIFQSTNSNVQSWNGTTSSGTVLPNGVYYVKSFTKDRLGSISTTMNSVVLNK